MAFLMRGCMALVGVVLMSQLDCVTIFTGLTGLFPMAPVFLAALPTSGPTALTPIGLTTTTTGGVILAVENDTDSDITVVFEADSRQYSATVPLAATTPKSQTYRFELSVPNPSLLNITTISNVDLNGLWSDPNTGQKLEFANGALRTFTDENGVVHVFDPNLMTDPNYVYSLGSIQRNIPTQILQIFIGTDDPNAGANNLNGRLYGLATDINGSRLWGKSLVGPMDSAGNPVPGATIAQLYHNFKRVFPSYIAAISETDKSPGTATVVRNLSYTSTVQPLTVNTDYQLGDTITFRVQNNTASFIHPYYSTP
jgi:hypothetical protein